MSRPARGTATSTRMLETGPALPRLSHRAARLPRWPYRGSGGANNHTARPANGVLDNGCRMNRDPRRALNKRTGSAPREPGTRDAATGPLEVDRSRLANQDLKDSITSAFLPPS